jgi:FtsP/CotA-like multicopper oxidase with cupredoxin domain
MRRDTVSVPRFGHAVLRFRANNPGIWAFHCHILWHLATGMMMQFASGMNAFTEQISHQMVEFVSTLLLY